MSERQTMNETPDNPDARLEGMLRRWGAAEAARTTQVPPAPAPPPARGAGAWGVVLRWGPLAAAAVLLIGAGLLYVAAAGRASPTEAPRIVDVHSPEPAALSDPNELARLRGQLEAQQRQLDALSGVQDKLTALESKLADANTQFEREQARHRTDVKELTTAVAAREKAVRKLNADLKAAEGRVATLDKQLAPLRVAAAELPTVRRDLEGVRSRLAAAGKELARARAARAEADKALTAARRELTLARSRTEEMTAVSRRTYLAAAAPGEVGLRARQVAVGSQRMIERLAALRGGVRGEAGRRLAEKLEVLLTRLEQLDAADAEGAESFSRLLAQSDVAGEIDGALAGDVELPRVRAWLFEAKLILTGL